MNCSPGGRLLAPNQLMKNSGVVPSRKMTDSPGWMMVVFVTVGPPPMLPGPSSHRETHRFTGSLPRFVSSHQSLPNGKHPSDIASVILSLGGCLTESVE